MTIGCERISLLNWSLSVSVRRLKRTHLERGRLWAPESLPRQSLRDRVAAELPDCRHHRAQILDRCVDRDVVHQQTEPAVEPPCFQRPAHRVHDLLGRTVSQQLGPEYPAA